MTMTNSDFEITIEKHASFDLQNSIKFEAVVEDYATGSLLHPALKTHELSGLPTLWIALRLIEIVSFEFLFRSEIKRNLRLWVPEEEVFLSLQMIDGCTIVDSIWVDGEPTELRAILSQKFCEAVKYRIEELLRRETDEAISFEFRKIREIQFLFGVEF